MGRPIPPLAYGGDYNPEQWPAAYHDEDVALMRKAGVDLVTLGVFSWAFLEPEEGRYELDWLAAIVDRLHAAGIAVDLATGTASPPPWFSRRYPHTLPQRADGTVLWPGSRQAFCPSSPEYLERATALARVMGERFGDHPALCLWHVSNEIGNHNALCYCDVSAAAFRRWLQERYGDVATLNEAWATAFWSQRYGSFDEVLPPRTSTAFANPTQQLDFMRFSSDQGLALFTAERDVLHEVSAGVPVTTNFMVMEHVRELDYWRWAREVDVVSNDHYLWVADPNAHQELAFSADLTRSVAGNRPWLLMEHSTSAVNWQPRNVAKRPGELARTSLQHVARGADAVLYFQWRASRGGAEKFHSALLPHAGTDTRLWREVVGLSRTLDRIEEVAGSRADNRVVMLVDWSARWAAELDSHPSADLRYLDRPRALYEALWDKGIGVDFAHPEQDLTGYDLVVVPTLYLVTDAGAARVREAAEAGATVLVTYFSGIVDEHDHIRLGGYPGAFRDLLGVVVEEFTPMLPGHEAVLDDGSRVDTWTEDLRLAGAEAVAAYVDGPVPGRPAITRQAVGAGSAWYLACRLDTAGTAALVDRLVAESGVRPVVETRPGVEVVRRVADDGRSWVFVLNHTDADATLVLHGHDLVAGTDVAGDLTVAAGGVAVVREER